MPTAPFTIMGITFDADDVLAITRRQINIPVENQAYTTSLNTLTSMAAMLLQVDNMNAEYYNFYNTQAQSYENEARALDGAIPATYSPTDLTNAAQNPTTAPFFPTSPTTYSQTIPLISYNAQVNDTVDGRFYPTGTDALYEGNTVSGLSTLITYFLAGSFSGTESTSTTIPAGPVTGLVLTVVATAGFSSGDVVSITNGSNSGVYIVTGTVLNTSITVNSVLPSVASMAGGTINGGSSALQTAIHTNITNWDMQLMTEQTSLTAQNDTRVTQSGQNATALTNVNAALTVVAAWLSSPSYTSGGLAPIQSELSTRNSFIPTRIAQINAALGGNATTALTQSGNTFSASDLTNSYYMRYSWLNFRINRSTGSLRRYYDTVNNQGAIQDFLSNNTAINAQYSQYFLTKALTFNDGSNVIHVTDLTGLSNGDAIVAVSETQPEVALTITALMGTTQIQVSAAVPTTYTLTDKARIFKVL